MSEKFKAYRGLAGGVLKAVAGFYLVFFTSLFTGVREVLEAARRELVAANLSSITGVESVVMGALEEAKSVLQGDALDIAFGVGLWALGTLLFAREWSRLASYWPGWARKAYAVVGWGLRLAAVAAGVLTAGIVSKALGGELPEVVEAFRSTWLFTHLYAAPLLAPLIYTLLALKYPPPGARLGLAVMVLGSLFYVYSIYNVVTAFRPLAEVSGALSSVYTAGTAEEALRDLAVAFIDAGLVAVERFKGAMVAVATASIIYTLGFALIALPFKARRE